MTAVVGLVHAGRVYIGADSLGSSGNQGAARADAKVFRVGPALFGYAGSYRGGQVIRYSFALPERDDLDWHAYMCTRFVDALRDAWRSAGYVGRSNEVEFVGTEMLVGFGGCLWSVHSDLQIGEYVEPWTAIGSGSEYALGSLWSTERVVGLRDQPETRVALALKAAARYCPTVGGPFTIEATDT